MSLDLKIKISGESKGAVNAAQDLKDSLEAIQKETKKTTENTHDLRDALDGINVPQGVQQDVEQLTERIRGGAQDAGAEVENLSGSFSGLSLGLKAGVVAVVAGFATFVKKGIDAADSFNDLSDRTGLAVEQLAAFKLAAEVGDTTIEKLAGSINDLTGNMSKNSGAFAALGIESKKPLDAFYQLSEVYKSIEDPQQRAAFGAKALGKSYEEMAPLLSMGAEELQTLIERGERFNPVTAEMAEQAGRFNDKITIMGGYIDGLAIKIGGPVLDQMDAFISKIIDAYEAGDKFNSVLKGINNYIFDGGNIEGVSKEIDKINAKIVAQKEKVSTLTNQGGVGGLVDSLLGYDVTEERRNLDNLLKEREQILIEFKTNRDAQSIKILAPSSDALDGFINTPKKHKASSRVAGSAVSSYEKERANIAKKIEDLQFELEIVQLSVDEKEKLSTIRSASAGATSAERDQIIQLVEAIDAETAAQKRQSEAWGQMVNDANELFDLKKRVGNFSVSNNMSTDSLNNIIADIQDTGADQGLSGEELKKLYDEAGQAFNEGFIDPAADGLKQLDEFGKQAARNIQDSFADFLFDPFKDGLDGMLLGFLDVIRRMAAEQAAAAIFGKGGLDLAGMGVSLLGSLASGLGGIFGGASSGIVSGGGNLTGQLDKFLKFENGGIMTSAGALPLRSYSSGGIANSPQLALFGEGRMNEAYVPLPDGRSIPVKMEGEGRQVVNHFNVTITTPDANSFRRSERQIRDTFQRATS